MRPRYVIVCKNQEHIGRVLGWDDPLQGAMNEDATILDGSKDDDFFPWKIMVEKRAKAKQKFVIDRAAQRFRKQDY